jgi:SAM-dependent methyltransferase
MQAYGSLFAKVYNQLWQNFARQLSPLVHQFYESTPLGQTHKTLLDLCCGTGQLSLYFLEHGYRVVGLDLSGDMLKYARENTLPFIVARQAQFVVGDASHFEFEETFGLVVATFDALNHLPDLEALQGCFRSSYAVLENGGTFIFDLNTRKGLEKWNGVNINPGEDIFLLNRAIYDEITVKALTKITGFVRTEEGLYQRFDETVYNSVFEMQAVMDMLLKSGFRSAYFARSSALEIPIDDPEGEDRAFFVARK